ncbi:hypothetical protein L0C47_23305, partial [Salmonella enterica subsp. enterica]|nr:hypothetical protein [Salmonella enterica subsp. enterica]
ITMNPVATSDAAFRGGACPTPEYTIAYTGNYTTSADANLASEPLTASARDGDLIKSVRVLGAGRSFFMSGKRLTMSGPDQLPFRKIILKRVFQRLDLQRVPRR